jgi:hypothetical protein
MFGAALFAASYFAGILTLTDAQPPPVPGPILGFIPEDGEDNPE